MAVSLAWLLLVFFLPLVGAIAYVVLGEKRLGRKFMARSRAIKGRYDSRLVQTTVNIPALSGNRIQLLDAA